MRVSLAVSKDSHPHLQRQRQKKDEPYFVFVLDLREGKKKGQDKLIDLGLISERHHSPFWKSALTSKILNLLYRIQ